MAESLGGVEPCFCAHPRGRIERYRFGLDLLGRERDDFSPQLRAALARQRDCHRGWQPGKKLHRLSEVRRRPNATLASACAAGRIGALVLCSQQRLLQNDYVGVLRNLEEANALVPFASHCLEQLSPGKLHDGNWLLSREEVYDNFRSAVRALGSIAMPEDEDGEGEEKNKGFFQQPIPEQEWLEQIPKKINDEKLAMLRWRSRIHPDSNVYFAVPPVRSAGAPKAVPDEDKPCGLSPAPPAKAQRPWATESSARQLSPSGCVWLLENACIQDRSIVLFAREGSEQLPKKLLGCGEFGNFEFNAVERHHPASRFLYPRNATTVDTLLIVPGMMSGVSIHNPFHLLHSTVPVAWQLHHPDYGLCIPRNALDIRFAFLNAFHARRQVHFWKVFSKKEGMPDIANMDATHVNIPSQWRFWWGPFAEMPPLPLGVDQEPRCYDRIIFGRELFRTGLGGFVTSRVVSFYHRYLEMAFSNKGGSQLPRSLRSYPFGGEYHMFRLMQPDPVHREDAAALAEIGMGSQFDRNYYSQEGLRLLSRSPAMVPLDKEAKEKMLLESEPEVEVRLLQSQPKEGPVKRIHVLWVQRPKRASRWIANMEEVASWIEGWAHPTSPEVQVVVLVAHFERLHPAAQFHLARQADVLVGVTGAAMAWSSFLHPGAAVLDLFPPGSKFCTEGWGNNVVSHFGGLARLSQLQHTCMEHPAALHGSETPVTEQEARYLADKEVKEKHGGYWHGQNVRLDMPKFRRVFLEAVDKVLPVRFVVP